MKTLARLGAAVLVSTLLAPVPTLAQTPGTDTAADSIQQPSASRRWAVRAVFGFGIPREQKGDSDPAFFIVKSAESETFDGAQT